MVLTDDVYLPTEEELKHKEIPLTHNFLISSAMWLGKYCDNQCKEFMLCRTEEADPRKCLEYGNEVTECGLEFFKKVKKTCRDELEWYTKCIDFSGPQPNFRLCRKQQALFDGCMYDSGFERANFGHFQLLRVHESERPRPKRTVPVFEDSVPYFDYKDPKHKDPGPGLGQRKMWEAWFK